MISQSETPVPEEIVVRKHQRDTASYTSSLSSEMGKTGLELGTRVNVTPEKRIPKKKKNIKYKALSPFLPVNKRLLNKDNDDNPKITDTSTSEKDDMSHTSQDNFSEKNHKTITNDYDEYKEETQKLQDGNKSVDNYETSDTLRDDNIIKTTKEEEALIQLLMTMNLKYHLIKYLIGIVSLCEKMIELEK